MVMGAARSIPKRPADSMSAMTLAGEVGRSLALTTTQVNPRGVLLGRRPKYSVNQVENPFTDSQHCAYDSH